jgi:hypothetical protein
MRRHALRVLSRLLLSCGVTSPKEQIGVENHPIQIPEARDAKRRGPFSFYE